MSGFNERGSWWTLLTEGEGATFTMELPLIPDHGEDDPDAVNDHLPSTAPPTSSESTVPGESTAPGEGTA